MQSLSVTTPALLFPAISLLLLAYTNRFQVLALLIRQLSKEHAQQRRIGKIKQLNLLRKRVGLIKYMQALGVLSFILCAFAMFVLFIHAGNLGTYLFGASLVTLVGSLLVALIEVLLSTNALEVEINDMEQTGS